jgi:3-phenylpropionate/trans-cinnamate dioxygenase ferredoxin component
MPISLSVASIAPGVSQVVDMDGVSVLVCNVEGTFHAIGNLCTHDDGPLGEGVLDGCEVTCPRHGARFDVKTGQALCLPAIGKVPTYTVTVKGDVIEIT